MVSMGKTFLMPFGVSPFQPGPAIMKLAASLPVVRVPNMSQWPQRSKMLQP